MDINNQIPAATITRICELMTDTATFIIYPSHFKQTIIVMEFIQSINSDTNYASHSIIKKYLDLPKGLGLIVRPKHNGGYSDAEYIQDRYGSYPSITL